MKIHKGFGDYKQQQFKIDSRNFFEEKEKKCSNKSYASKSL